MGLSAIEKFNARLQKSDAYKKAQQKTDEAGKEVKTNETVTKITSDTVEGGYYKFHVNSNADVNKHYFLSEETLVPFANHTDTQRQNMLSNHINQFVHLVAPEFPKVFTNFENQVGEYSIAYKRAEKTFEVIAKVVKNAYNYDLIVKYKNGVYDIIHYRVAVNITEDYGYKLNDCISNIQPGDTVKEGAFLYKSDNYDDDGNFSYGVNLKALYIPFHNKTYEDGVVISESAAKRLTSYKVENTMFTVNGNDILLNLYGDDKSYKSFPKVGDHINERILVASRRKDKKSALYDFQSSRVRTIDPSTDEVIYTGGGTVVDIDVYSNASTADLELLRKRGGASNLEILEVIDNNKRYWKELATELEKIIPCKVLTDAEKQSEKSEFGHVCRHPIPREENENKYTDELAYYWKLAHEYIDEKILWRYDGKSFDNFKLKFTILKENPLTPGCKLTGRYGNKGVCTEILPDDQMPVTEDGVRADVCLNPLGVFNRLNISQTQEQYLNFMSDHVLKLMKAEEDYDKKAEIFFDFLKEVNKAEYDYFDIEYMMMNRLEKEDFIREVEENGIYLHEPPFFGNTTGKQFKKIFKEHPEWCTEYKFVGIEKPMTMGDIYFMRLKHESSNKASMRSASNLNVKNLPAKSTLKKEKKVLYSNTPIRLGEMEVTNLMIAKHPEIVEKLLKTYATNEDLREATILQLLRSEKLPNGHIKNVLNMDLDVNLDGNKTVSREILDKYLNVLGYSLKDNSQEDK